MKKTPLRKLKQRKNKWFVEENIKNKQTTNQTAIKCLNYILTKTIKIL